MIPLSVVLTELMNFSLNLVAVFVFILAYGVDPLWTWLLFPVLVGALLVLTIAVAMILSALYPRFRDIALIWGVLSTRSSTRRRSSIRSATRSRTPTSSFIR